MTTDSIKNPEINYLYLLLIRCPVLPSPHKSPYLSPWHWYRLYQGRQRALEHLALFVTASNPLRDGLFDSHHQDNRFVYCRSGEGCAFLGSWDALFGIFCGACCMHLLCVSMHPLCDAMGPSEACPGALSLAAFAAQIE